MSFMTLSINNNEHSNSKRFKTFQTDKTYLWHLQFSHVGLTRIQRLVKNGPLSMEIGLLPE